MTSERHSQVELTNGIRGNDPSCRKTVARSAMPETRLGAAEAVPDLDGVGALLIRRPVLCGQADSSDGQRGPFRAGLRMSRWSRLTWRGLLRARRAPTQACCAESEVNKRRPNIVHIRRWAIMRLFSMADRRRRH